MSEPFTIRRARGEDAAALSDMILRSKRSNGYDDAFMAACADELRLTTDDIAACQVWLATGDPVKGCVSLRCDSTAPEGKIESFFVDPSAKRQGVGRKLWHVVLEAAQAQGLQRLTLDADPAAVSFYEAMGFAVFREVPSGSIPGRMLPQMALTL